MEFSLPKKTEDLRIKHYSVLRSDIYAGEMDLALKIDFLSDFLGESKQDLKTIYPPDIERMYNHCVQILSGYKPKAPPKQIEINGKKYDRVNPFKVASGWHIDFSNTDVNRDFVRLAALFYHPTGVNYSAVDENKNLISPLYERIEEFKEHFPLPLFLDSSAFFLTKYKQSIDKYMVSQKIREKLKKIPVLSLMIGKRR